MKFMNLYHKRRYQKIKKLYPKSNSELQGVLYIISGNQELYKKILPALENRSTCAYDLLNSESFSSEATVLAELAMDIYKGEDSFHGSDLFQLNQENFTLAIRAKEYGFQPAL
ncbi:hypothetical protein RZN22_15390 [Bacillaceae bacterium S4-13-58]